MIEFLKALEVLLLAAGTKGSKQRNRACGEMLLLCDFLLTPGHECNMQGGEWNGNMNIATMMIMLSYLVWG